jgi:hypothetical protein
LGLWLQSYSNTPGTCSQGAFNQQTAPSQNLLYSNLPFIIGVGSHPPKNTTSTYKDYVPDLGCFWDGFGYATSVCGNYFVLSNEDTEDSAMNRKNDTIANWTPVNNNATSYRSTRVADQYDFSYRSLQYRINASGCFGAGNLFNVFVDLYSRPYPSTEAYRLDGQLFYQLNGTVDGNVQSPWIAVPTVTGREVMLQGCLITQA